MRRRIGVLSDARGLYPRLTARENVRYYGQLHGLSGPMLDARIDELVTALGLAPLADRRTQGFSQGERMKVAIARALVHDPDTILLYEPTNGLDIMSTRAPVKPVASVLFAAILACPAAVLAAPGDGGGNGVRHPCGPQSPGRAHRTVKELIRAERKETKSR